MVKIELVEFVTSVRKTLNVDPELVKVKIINQILFVKELITLKKY